jgi:hypothetical protein
MHPITEQLLALTEQPYDNYNHILKEIKEILGSFDNLPERVEAFEITLKEELPLTTARRAYRTAIRLAMGEENVPREWKPAEALQKKFPKKSNR